MPTVQLPKQITIDINKHITFLIFFIVLIRAEVPEFVSLFVLVLKDLDNLLAPQFLVLREMPST